MPFRTFVSQVFVELESSYSGPAAGNVMAAFNAKYSEHKVDMTERADVTGTFMKFAPIPGQRMGRISFDCYLKGSGAAGTAPEFGDALIACGMNEAVVGGASVTYKPLITATSVASVSLYNDGIRYAVAGAVGTLSIKADVGKPMVASFDFTGLMQAVSDQALIGATTYDATVPPAFMGSTVTIFGVTTGVVRNLSWDLGNKVTMRDDINAASGYIGAFLSDQKTVGTFTLETPTVAAHDLWTKLQTPTSGTMSHVAIGAAGNKVQIVNTDCWLLAVGAPEDADGRSLITCNFLSGTTGSTTAGNNMQLIFT